MEEFKKLGIIDPILDSIKEHGFEEPTEVQLKSIPEVIKGKDIIAGAATGSGKTLAFGTGIIQNSERLRVIQALVLVPTRELAEQVTQTLRSFSKYKKLNVVEVYGGVSIINQIQQLRKADVVVGTPGRILDHLSRGTIELGYVKTLVLDEADRMLDMGFIYDVKKIIGQCPKERQTMLFSATISPDVLRLSKDYMNNPIEVDCETKVDASKLKQIYYDVPDNLKFSLLVQLLKKERSGLVMVFCNTQRNTDFVARNLKINDINALAIHGGYSQNKRRDTMNKFHAQDIDVLVCTDVAARGLDIKEVSHVYNYDIPREPIQYIHRIGRTARAGKEGMAISIIASRDYENFSKLINREDTKIDKKESPEIERALMRIDKERRGFGGDRRRSFNRGGGGSRFRGGGGSGGGGGGRRFGGDSGGSRFRNRRDSRSGGGRRFGQDREDSGSEDGRKSFNHGGRGSRFRGGGGSRGSDRGRKFSRGGRNSRPSRGGSSGFGHRRS